MEDIGDGLLLWWASLSLGQGIFALAFIPPESGTKDKSLASSWFVVLVHIMAAE